MFAGSRFLFLLARILPLLSALTRALSAVMGALPLLSAFPWADATDEESGLLHNQMKALPLQSIPDSTS